MEEIAKEVESSTERHGGFHSAHEGYGVILEELDEAWDEIKKNNQLCSVREMYQVAVMAVKYIMTFDCVKNKNG